MSDDDDPHPNGNGNYLARALVFNTLLHRMYVTFKRTYGALSDRLEKRNRLRKVEEEVEHIEELRKMNDRHRYRPCVDNDGYPR